MSIFSDYIKINGKRQMIKPLYILQLLLILCVSCSEDKQPVVVKENPKHDGYSKLLSKYEQISLDTFKVHYTYSEEKKDKFQGTALDSLDLLLFPSSLRGKGNFDQFYACYRFSIDSTQIGLITRTPSMYESSSINMFIYDRHADSILYYFEIAEEWGDAGSFFTKTSWIYTGSNIPKVFTLEDYSYSNSAEDVTDTTIELKTTSYLLQINKFGFDTVIKNDSLLRLKFH